MLNRLRSGLSKTREGFVREMLGLLGRRAKFDEALFAEIEELLLAADVGVGAAARLVDALRAEARQDGLADAEAVRETLKREIVRVLDDAPGGIVEPAQPPGVVMVVGVNGSGKTTTVAKLAHILKREGKSVLLVAADTFRAAGIEQLEAWARRARVDLVRHGEGADPSAVAFDGVRAALARKMDYVLIDTAGRLHTKVGLMQELGKMRRVLSRQIAGAPHEVLLVLDATTGQNALSQARLFGEATGVTGIALVKMDGTAKGGIIIAIRTQLGLPIKFIGVGERIDDLKEFDAREFVEALF